MREVPVVVTSKYYFRLSLIHCGSINHKIFLSAFVILHIIDKRRYIKVATKKREPLGFNIVYKRIVL